jgi:membrane-bound lytic murein transglycosylase D
MDFRSAVSTRLPEPELIITPEVQRELDRFLARDRQSIVQGLKRRDAHYHTMSRIFSEYGVPLDLLNVAMIESGFQPEARSNVGAVGIWQFMKSTARVYGLKVGTAEDQRKDPVLSSVAAARHLRDLYLKYNDWNLALAAYNAGCGSLARSMRGTQKTDFWSLARRGSLRGQTARFVPRFIATAIIARNLKHYGFESEVETSLAKNSIDERYASRTTANWAGIRRTPIG